MILVKIKIKLKYPYIVSLTNLFDFISLWGGKLISAKSVSGNASICLDSKKFKIIFNTNPQVKKYIVPNNLQYFIDDLEVVEIITNE